MRFFEYSKLHVYYTILQVLTCCGVVPGTSREIFSHILPLEGLNSTEFIKVLSIRSRATALEAEPLFV